MKDNILQKFSTNINKITLLILVLILLGGCEENKSSEKNIKHIEVYYEEDRFAGWPANHGIWIWEDEILVGFVQANHMKREGHTYDQSTARDKYARSQDGGLSWTIEDAYEHGQTGWRYNNRLEDENAESPVELTESIDFSDPNLALTFLRQTNNIGPSHFYYSYDRGKFWHGPFELPNMDTPGIATRTDYIINGENELLAFFTVAKSNEHEGRILCARTIDGGVTWEKVAWIGPEPDGFDIMPSSLRLSETDLITVIRSRDVEPRRDFLKAFRSNDNGESWERLQNPVEDTGSGGSPPALIEMQDGRLALAYIYRSENGSRVNIRYSSDEGESWGDEIVLRGNDGANRDVGYPRMVQRPDGKLVIVYYWNNALLENSTPYRYIAVTILDPNRMVSS